MSPQASGPQPPVRLDHLRAIRVAGADRRTFLQGQLTQDMGRLDDGVGLLAGWANAKGRLLLVTQLAEWQDAVWLTAPAALADTLARRLQMFVLRASVNIDVPPVTLLGLTAATAIPPSAAACGIPQSGSDEVCADAAACLMRVRGDPSRIIMLTHAAELPDPQPSAGNEWELADIRAGLPRIAPETAETFVPQMVNLDLLDAISFTKGCYVGQEIVARTQNLGRIKRRMIRLSATQTRPLSPGDPVYADPDTVCGRVVRSAGSGSGVELLAVVPLDALGTPMFADALLTQPLIETSLPYSITQP